MGNEAGGGRDSRPGRQRRGPEPPGAAGPGGHPERPAAAPQPAWSDPYADYRRGVDLLGRGSPAAAAQLLERAAAMRPELQHYHDALRSVRATLRARSKAAAGGPEHAGGQPRQDVQPGHGHRAQAGRGGPAGRQADAVPGQCGKARDAGEAGEAGYRQQGEPPGSPRPGSPA